MKKKLLSIFALSIFSLTFAQVGIGTKTPDKSASLDVDANIDGTLKGGVLLPRVALTSNDDATTIATPAVGLMVYNNGTALPVGHYIWNGTEWLAFDTSPVIDKPVTPPPGFSLGCSSATLFPAIYKTNEPYTGTLTVPYAVGDGARYSRGDADLNTGNGTLRYRLVGGKLDVGSGNITYDVFGTPTHELPTTFLIDFYATQCNAVVGTGITINTIKYSEKTTTLDANTTQNSETRMGSLKARYNGTATGVGYIEFTTDHPTHITWIYHKGGYQMANIETYGRTASKGDTWYRFNGIINSGGLTTENASNLNPTNRDIGYATLTLHDPAGKKNEVYRVTLNAAGAIAASNGVDAITKGSVTIFIEQLEAAK